MAKATTPLHADPAYREQMAKLRKKFPHMSDDQIGRFLQSASSDVRVVTPAGEPEVPTALPRPRSA